LFSDALTLGSELAIRHSYAPTLNHVMGLVRIYSSVTYILYQLMP